MPELPEVETSVRGIRPYLVNETIKKIIIRQSKLRWPVSHELNHIGGAIITNIYRRAKYLILNTNKGDVLIHLGMSGSLMIITPTMKKSLTPHDHIDLETETGIILRYNDPRRFGAWLWVKEAQQTPILAKLGPEPLSSNFNATYLYQQSRNKKVAIKNLIMNNLIVVGVGNIYACEALFLAKINPALPSQKLTYSQCEKLVEAIQNRLHHAILAGGTTLKDFTQPDGKLGYFKQKLAVYGRKGECCFCCKTMIATTYIGQRNTFYCPQCQI